MDMVLLFSGGGAHHRDAHLVVCGLLWLWLWLRFCSLVGGLVISLDGEMVVVVVTLERKRPLASDGVVVLASRDVSQ